MFRLPATPPVRRKAGRAREATGRRKDRGGKAIRMSPLGASSRFRRMETRDLSISSPPVNAKAPGRLPPSNAGLLVVQWCGMHRIKRYMLSMYLKVPRFVPDVKPFSGSGRGALMCLQLAG